MTDLQATLASLAMFRALDADELPYVAGQVQSLSLTGGSTLVSEGDEANEMFVVVSGLLTELTIFALGNL